MARTEEVDHAFTQEDHQAAYIFDPDEGEARRERPSKRRRVSKGNAKADKTVESLSLLTPLFDGAEGSESVRLRETLFEQSWGIVNGRIQNILRDSNSATLDQVSAFVGEAKTESADQIPSAFIITGPNIASQDLLFGQLSETLQRSSPSRFVRLRSSEASTLKATLKKIIRDVTARTSEGDGDDLQVGAGQEGRRYLDYDLEALYAFIKTQECEHVFVAFQDSEGFDSALLSDLITLFNSWRPQIPFTLLFGIATSVELLQARLLKSACRLIYGAQFDVVQTETILETVFQSAVAAADVPLQLGGPLLRGMLERQRDQVAGIQAFISSLKYAYMCHFYANPLSIIASPDESSSLVTEEIIQAEHVESTRHLPSFRLAVEQQVDIGTENSINYARQLLESDQCLHDSIHANPAYRRQWICNVLRALLILEAAGAQTGTFSKAFVQALDEGISMSAHPTLVESVRRLTVSDLLNMLRRVIAVLTEGDPNLSLGPSLKGADQELRHAVEGQLAELETLQAKAADEDFTLRSRYSGHGKVMRTTVIAQKVQLSQDSATLREEDNQLTEIIDEITKLLSSMSDVPRARDVFLSECWLYDSKSPARDVFVPRPRAVFQRSLARPHDYLACACCKPGEAGIQATSPATSILYHLYLETGSLMNVADMWSAFFAVVSEEEQDERKALVAFYRGLSELRALGFVRASKRKADHIAKVKWL